MSKMANRWEIPVSTIIPYMQWSEVVNGEITSWKTGRHNHASFELHIILSGECKLFINNSELTLSSGEGILISPEVFHAPNSVSSPFCRLSLSFSPDDDTRILNLFKGNSHLIFPIESSLKNLCFDIFSESQKPDSVFHKELLANQFGQLILRVLRIIEEKGSNSLFKKAPAKELEDITFIDIFFMKTPPKERTKENLAKLLHCSTRQVLRKINALYGISFQKKQMLSRIDTAQHLLRVTDKSIDEICAEVGYSDKAAFYKAFKLYTNTTPLKFRRGDGKI